jgi:hypothetical protein
VKQAFAYLAAVLLTACAPDIDANGAERCDEQAACGAGAACYRGFCVPDPSDGSTEDLGQVGLVQSADAGTGLLSLDSGSHEDAGPDDPVGDAGAVADASKMGAADVGPTEPLDAGTPSPRPPPTADASMPKPGDAATPVVSPPCTLKICCDEAKEAREAGEKPDGRWNGKKGKCGCRDPDVLSTLACGVSMRVGIP